MSQAIGVGGRDLSEAVGGLATLAALERLTADRETRVIVLVSKPPTLTVAQRVVAAARRLRKPFVTCFLDSPAMTLEDAAGAAVALLRRRKPATRAFRPGKLPRIAASRRTVSGLFSGGTFSHEAALLLDGTPSRVVDLGDDAFTRGRPHPMIDPRLRLERIAAEAADRNVGVLLLDVVLGDGAHADPAGALAPALKAVAKRGIAVVASVCGTEGDPQVRSKQVETLKSAGVLVAASNAQAARLAAKIVR